MLVWGGKTPSALNTGGQYDPASDSWTGITAAGAPAARFGHTAVWTGLRMFVWGGFALSVFNTGGQYDPATDSWSAMTTLGAPSARFRHAAMWTGSRILIWGGDDGLNAIAGTGGRYLRLHLFAKN